ncbi:hypothetical protein WDU94_002989 [Cyamophila willieti]
MKAIPADILSNNNNIINGKINKPHNKTKNIENEEIQMYLSKLKDLVPFMPKNKKLSKLEVIHYVIEYICDLQYALETHPTLDSSAVESAAIAMLSANAASQSDEEEVISRTSSNSRQPLGVLIPNPIVKSSLVSSSDVSSSSSSISDKVSSSSDSRSVSV